MRVAGGTERQAFTRVTFPLSGSALQTAWALVFISALMEISMTIMLYSTKSATASVQVWLQEANGQLANAHALGAILATVGFIVLVIQQRIGRGVVGGQPPGA
jgi:iron(III) transport system permease protein